MESHVVALAKKLITAESVTGNQSGMDTVLGVVKKELEGFRYKEYTQNGVRSLLFYNAATTPGKFRVLYNVHVDVVPAGKSEQFHPSITGDKLYGRGAYDMKGAAAAEILAFKECAKQCPYPVGLQVVTDEEVGGFNGTKYQVAEGVLSDFVLVGECGTDLDIGVAAKGILWMRITVHGVAAHGAHPWKGENAVWNMYDFLGKIRKAYPIPASPKWVTTVNAGSVETQNKTFNKVPDSCTVMLDIRYIPEDKEGLSDRIRAMAPKGSDVSVEVFEPSCANIVDNEYIKALKKVVRDVTGKQSEFLRMHGASDLRHFKQGTSAVEFGPAGEGQHTDNEWVSIKSLDEYHRILLQFLKSVR